MRFNWQTGDDTKWHRKFAWLPAQVGRTADGEEVFVWLEFFEQRRVVSRVTPDGVEHYPHYQTFYDRRLNSTSPICEIVMGSGLD